MEAGVTPPASAPPEPRRVLYRCPNRTNLLCPCGAAARKLNKLGVEYRTERVPYRRRNRPEIVELTRQKYVPVFVDGEEVISDSKRIREYVEWRYGGENSGVSEAPSTIPGDD